MSFVPRVIRHKDAPQYLGVNVNYFNKYIRPDLKEISFGPQMIGYDKIDLDRWLDDYKSSNGRSGNRKEANKPCRQKSREFQASFNGETYGGLTRDLEDKEFVKAVERATTTKH